MIETLTAFQLKQFGWRDPGATYVGRPVASEIPAWVLTAAAIWRDEVPTVRPARLGGDGEWGLVAEPDGEVVIFDAPQVLREI